MGQKPVSSKFKNRFQIRKRYLKYTETSKDHYPQCRRLLQTNRMRLNNLK